MMYTLIRFNGERCDPASGALIAGNGYRSYDPGLMRFGLPDSMSPFEKGGINSYVWSEGDPVNRADPSGHSSIMGWLGIGTGMILGALFTPISLGSSLSIALSAVSVLTGLISTGLAIACQLQEGSDKKTTLALDWSALGLGIISGLSSALMTKASFTSFTLFTLARRIKGTGNRPLGGLMMAGRSTRPRINSPLQLSTVGNRERQRYEIEAYSFAQRPLSLPPRMRIRNHYLPMFGEHRRMAQVAPAIPVYSVELQQLVPLPRVLHDELQELYTFLGMSEAQRTFRVTSEMPVRYESSIYTSPEGSSRPVTASQEFEFPPAYVGQGMTSDSACPEDENLLDYHYVTRL